MWNEQTSIRNIEGSNGHFFKKLSGFDDNLVSYKKDECIPLIQKNTKYQIYKCYVYTHEIKATAKLKPPSKCFMGKCICDIY